MSLTTWEGHLLKSLNEHVLDGRLTAAPLAFHANYQTIRIVIGQNGVGKVIDVLLPAIFVVFNMPYRLICCEQIATPQDM